MLLFFFLTDRIFHVFWIQSEGFYWLDWLNKQPAHMTCTANLRAEKGFHNKKISTWKGLVHVTKATGHGTL